MKPGGKVELLIRAYALPPFHTSWLYPISSSLQR